MDADGATPGGRSWTRADGLALGGLVLVALAGAALLVQPWYDATTDGSVYLLTARALGAGEGYTYLGRPFVLRPPGFSALLVPFVRADAVDFQAVQRAVALTATGVVALFFVHFRSRLGTLPAAAAALLLWALPGFQRLACQVMTDVPGAALLLACLLVERHASRRPSLARELALGLLVGASAWFRSAFLLLVPAVLLSRALRPSRLRGPRTLLLRTVPFAAAAVLAALPWSLRNAAVRPEPPADQTTQYSTRTLVLHEDARDPGSPRVPWSEVLSRPRASAAEAVRALGGLQLTRPEGRAVRAPGPRGEVVLGLALFAALAVALARRREPGEVFVALFLATVFVFPTHFLDRYALPVLLLALPAAVELARAALGRLPLRGARDVALAGALLVLAALAFEPRAHWDEVRREHEDLAAIRDFVRETTAPDARLAAAVGWHLSLFLGRPVHSLRFGYQRAGGPEGAEAVIDRYGLDTVVLVSSDRPASRLQPWFASRYGTAAVRAVGEKGVSIHEVRAR